MKRSDLLASLMLLIGIVLFAPAVSASGFQSRVFIDDGKLYGVSEDALLVHDLATGELTIDYADGEQFRDVASNWPGTQGRGRNPLLSGTFWLGASGDNDRGVGISTASCSSKAAAVQSAVATVQAACADGPSRSCASAREALISAQDEYAECLRVFLEQY